MDLSRLTCPAILCQCSRCSSSLAALENEWAKLSNSYSMAAGWLSVELHRISISPEKKQIPQSSDLRIIRGRIIQEIGCKLCQQKLGVLCVLENGPNIFWKLSKVAFREIVTMRTVEPSFKGGSPEDIVPAAFKDNRRDRTPTNAGALVPTGSNEIDNYNGTMEQHIQHQGLSLDHISSSVSNLHDTMSELKQAFTALRIELNGPSRFPSEITTANGADFNMITTVLKELKLKSEEIEKLKLEIEALKLRNRYMEERPAAQITQSSLMEEVLPEVATPGLLQGSRKRPYPEYFPSGRSHPIADSFADDDDDEDSIADFSLEGSSIPPVRVPVKDFDATQPRGSSAPSPLLRIEVGQSTHQSNYTKGPETNAQQQAIVKRRRLSHSTEGPPPSEKKRPGRPRKSISQTTRPDAPTSQTPKPTPLSEHTGNGESNGHREPVSSNATTPNDQRHTMEIRPTRSRTLRGRSRPPSPSRRTESAPDAENNGSAHEQSQNPGSNQPDQGTDSGKENPPVIAIHGAYENGEYKPAVNEKRKALTAARDIMAKLAMQREEAMDTEESR